MKIRKPRNAHECIHYWANQSLPSARTSNVFYYGETCYSYGTHFPLGKLVVIGKSQIALLNPNRYSISTSKHQSWVRSAVSHLNPTYVLPVYWDSIKDRRTLASAIKKTQKDLAASAEADKRFRNQIAREKRQAKRDALKADESFLADLEAWRNGGNRPASRFFQASTYLRVSGSEIETSKGARVPLIPAFRAFPFLRDAIAAELAKPDESRVYWQPFFELPEFNWGAYRGLRCISRGSSPELIVGCHTIPWSEIESLATRHADLLAQWEAGKQAA